MQRGKRVRYRLIFKAQKVRERLGGDLGVANPFPAKPKGMHWRRYDRLRARHDQAVDESLRHLRVAAFSERNVEAALLPSWRRRTTGLGIAPFWHYAKCCGGNGAICRSSFKSSMRFSSQACSASARLRASPELSRALGLPAASCALSCSARWSQ